MSIHPLAARFGEVADAYERGRPDYPPAVTDAITAELSLPSGARVLDLGAGTGKLTRALVDAGLDVIAVEPQAPLRAMLASSVGAQRVRDGTAEAIPLEDSTMRAVTIADAFHWFDHQLALAEIERVLEPRGGLVVVTSAPDLDGASWAHEVASLVASSRPEHPHYDGSSWKEAVGAVGGWTEPREVRVNGRYPADSRRLLDWITSFSWIAAMAPDERAGVLARAEQLIVEGHTPTTFAVHFTVAVAKLR